MGSAACGTDGTGEVGDLGGGGGSGANGGSAATGGSSQTGGQSGGGSGGTGGVETCPELETLVDPEFVADYFPSTNGLQVAGDTLYLANGEGISHWHDGMASFEMVVSAPIDWLIGVVGNTVYYVTSGSLFGASLADAPAAGALVSTEPIPDLARATWTHDDEAFYFADFNDGIVRRVPFDGSPGTELAQADQPRKLSSVGGWLYFTSYLDSHDGFRRVPSAGGADETATAAEVDGFLDFATDGDLFWVAGQDNLAQSSVGSSEEDALVVTNAKVPTLGLGMNHLQMVEDTLYLQHTEGGCARVTADGVCRMISKSFDGSSYGVIGDYVYYVAFSDSTIRRFRR